ncbi:MAG: S8 family peptidase, partial [bacterium]
MDTGIRETHREFAGDGKLQVEALFPDDTEYTLADSRAQADHGTSVAAVAAGNRDGVDGGNMQGVAFDAALHFAYLDLRPDDFTNSPIDLSMRGDDYYVDFYQPILDIAERVDASIINQSFGVFGAISLYEEMEVRRVFSKLAAVFEQADTDAADRKIFVWAAGNAKGMTQADGEDERYDSPEILAGLGVHFEELQTHVLAVVSVDQNGKISSFSNHCGVAKDFCLAAPGEDITSAVDDDDAMYHRESGTSFAAPVVSGSLAVLRDYFDGQLGNTELVTRLLATADRTDIYADSDIYGRGLLDLDAATRPVGMIMAGLPGSPGNQPFAGTELALSGGAFGASLQRQLAGVEVAGFDALGAPFMQSAAGWATPSPRRNGGDRADAREVALHSA